MKKDLLKKMKMPEKKQDDMLQMDEHDLDLGSAAGEHPEEMDMGAPEDEQGNPAKGEESPEEENAELHHMPDEDLVKELEARGFKVQRPAKGEESEEEESKESPEEESAENESEEQY
jgi:hypothetical protein